MLRTPLHKFHEGHGAKFVEFAGWEMPILYNPPSGEAGGITSEHLHVRASGGLFDVSHMGRLSIKGRHARRFLERLCSRRISNMQNGQCRYALICNEQGGVKDDVLVYRLDDDDFLVVVNAANRQKILEHIDAVRDDLVFKLDDRTEKTAMVAIQGPSVMDLISRFSSEIPTLKRYRFTHKNLLIAKVLVSRTGYTGEDGIEVILPANMVDMALKLMLKDVDESASDSPIRPAGLGARDTLRLEAGMPLYGNELLETIPATASGMGFALDLDKHEDERGEMFIGQQALLDIEAAGGPERVLVGLSLEGKRTPRSHMKVLGAGGAEIGEVTSGCMSPTLRHPIAMAYVDRASSEPDTSVEIDTGRGEPLPARITALPFYKAPKKEKKQAAAV